MPVGRPTKYKAGTCDKVKAYIDGCIEGGEEIPTKAGLSLYLDVTRETVDSWSKSKPEFSDAVKRVTQIQQKMLLNKGLTGEYNSTIAKLLLSSNHGMSEKTEHEHSGGLNITITN